MPAATQSSGTVKYETFDERRYVVRVLGCKESFSPQDGRAQYEWEFAIEGTEDADTGREITTRKWCSTIWNDTPEKESHLVVMARALFGRPVTFEEWEALSFDELRDLRASALVVLNTKGYPDLDKESFKPAAPKAASPARTATPAPAAAAPPPAAAAPADDSMTDKTRQKITKLAAAEDLTDDMLARHCREVLGATWPDLTEAQGKQLTEALLAEEVAPF